MKQASNLVNFISSKGSETYHNIILRIAQDFVGGGGGGEWIVGGLVASWLARSSQDIASCFWARHSPSASPLQGPATLMQGVSSHPGGILTSCYKNREKLRPDGHLARMKTLSIGRRGTYKCHTFSYRMLLFTLDSAFWKSVQAFVVSKLRY